MKMIGSWIGSENGASALSLLAVVGLLGGCSADEGSGERAGAMGGAAASYEEDDWEEFIADLFGDALEEPTETVVTSREEALDEFFPQTVRWRRREIALEKALLRSDIHQTGDYVEEYSELILKGSVRNRVAETGTFDPSWTLILKDGTRAVGYQESVRLEPEVTEAFRVSFDLPEGADLKGALIEPLSDTVVGEPRPLRIPFDEEFESPYPFVIEELQGLKMETLNPESSSQWKMKVQSALVTLDSDYGSYDWGSRPEYGNKLIELVIEAELLEGRIPDNFWGLDFELRVDGERVRGDMDGEVLSAGERHTDGLTFEIDEDVNEFEFHYQLESAGDPKPQVVVVQLPDRED